MDTLQNSHSAFRELRQVAGARGMGSTNITCVGSLLYKESIPHFAKMCPGERTFAAGLNTTGQAMMARSIRL
jgi:hypothetical protein